MRPAPESSARAPAGKQSRPGGVGAGAQLHSGRLGEGRVQGSRETRWSVLSPNPSTTGHPCAWQVAPPVSGTERGQGLLWPTVVGGRPGPLRPEQLRGSELGLECAGSETSMTHVRGGVKSELDRKAWLWEAGPGWRFTLRRRWRMDDIGSLRLPLCERSKKRGGAPGASASRVGGGGDRPGDQASRKPREGRGSRRGPECPAS